MELRSQLMVGLTRLPVLLLAAVAASLVTYMAMSDGAPTYQSTTTLMVGRPLDGSLVRSDELLVAQQLPAAYATIAGSRPFLERVSAKLSQPVSTRRLDDDLDIVIEADSSVFELVARAADPALALEIATVAAEELMRDAPGSSVLDPVVQRALETSIAGTKVQIAEVQVRVDSLSALPSLTPAQAAQLATAQAELGGLVETYRSLTGSLPDATFQLTMVQPAILPEAPLPRRALLFAALAAGLAGIVVVGLMALRAYLDDRVRTRDELERLTGVPTLAAISRITGRSRKGPTIAMLGDPQSRAAESYRTLRANTDLVCSRLGVRSLLVTSADRGEGRTTTAANLAVAFALNGRRVVLIDGDLRHPRVHLLLGVPQTPGLANVLRSRDLSTLGVFPHAAVQGLEILPSGTPGPEIVDLFDPRLIKAIVERAATDADLVVIDAPGLREVSDAAILSACADATLLVVDASRTHRPDLIEVLERLEQAQAVVVGAVLNRAGGAGLRFASAERDIPSRSKDRATSSPVETSSRP